jgi:hypothetical protein
MAEARSNEDRTPQGEFRFQYHSLEAISAIQLESDRRAAGQQAIQTLEARLECTQHPPALGLFGP